jgi:hypothetical protein
LEIRRIIGVDPDSGAFVFGRNEWRDFINGAKNDEFDE